MNKPTILTIIVVSVAVAAYYWLSDEETPEISDKREYSNPGPLATQSPYSFRPTDRPNSDTAGQPPAGKPPTPPWEYSSRAPSVTPQSPSPGMGDYQNAPLFRNQEQSYPRTQSPVSPPYPYTSTPGFGYDYRADSQSFKFRPEDERSNSRRWTGSYPRPPGSMDSGRPFTTAPPPSWQSPGNSP